MITPDQTPDQPTIERPCPHCGLLVRYAKPVNLGDNYRAERAEAEVARLRLLLRECRERARLPHINGWSELGDRIDAALAEPLAEQNLGRCKCVTPPKIHDADCPMTPRFGDKP